MFSLPPVYPIINIDTVSNPIGFASLLFDVGIALLQVRAKNQTDRRFLEIASAICEERKRFNRSKSTDCQVIINDRVDICLMTQANGVHLGQHDISPHEARKLLGPAAIIGLSTHTLEELRRAKHTPADYIGFGPIFPTATKKLAEAVVGVNTLRQAIKMTSIPLVAIGGITIANVPEVYRIGVKSVAVIRDLQLGSNIGEQIKNYTEAYGNCSTSGSAI